MFITLEGGEATGKSTVAKELVDRLNKETEFNAVLTREPGGHKISEDIRALIMKHDNIPAEVETMLFNAARYINVNKVIAPELAKGNIVVCDRYTDSTLVYQGMMKGHNITDIMALNDIGSANTYPDITFVLDLPSEVAMERLSSRGKENRFDDMTIEEFDVVRTSFLNIANNPKYSKGNHIIIDANKEVKDIVDEILDKIKEN